MNEKKPTSADKSAPKQRGRPFRKGESGNPAGKPRGTRSHATRLLLSMMEGGAEEITKAVIDKAKEGDLAAARLVLERIVPPAKERPISVALPDISTVEGVSAAQAAILQAVGAGDLLPGEASTLSGIVEARRKAIETEELETRIAALEQQKESKK